MKNKPILKLILILLVVLGLTYIDFKGVDPQGTGSAAEINLGLDLAGGVSITYQVVGEEEPDATEMSDTIAKLQKRVEVYSTEAIVYQEGADRICIEIPGVSDANVILQELGRPGALYFISQTDDEGELNFTVEMAQTQQGYVYQYVLNKTIPELLEDGSILVQGTDVKDAKAGTLQDNMGNSQYAVSLTMTEEGAQKFAQATERAAAKQESLAIYYDGEIISAPAVNEMIPDGNAQISPMESYEKAESLASTIRIGGLKLELEELHSKVVGAQLGVEAISTSLIAGAVGLLLVILLMCVIYRIPGVAASIALTFYVAATIWLLNGFDMTLTLSGIAGIILSIGMAVDANVIIFERIKEEIGAGEYVRGAIKVGFEKALSAIVDGNITTLIAAAVLWVLGPGSVKGFAQTLALGIALSMFTAVVITKYILYAFYDMGITNKKLYGKVVNKEKKVFDLLSKKGLFFGIAGVVIAAGLVTMGIYKFNSGSGLNYSLEFKGGTATTVAFEDAMTLEEVNADVLPMIEDVVDGAVQIQTVQGSNEVIFKTNTLEAEDREALNQMFFDEFGLEESNITSETISSTISDEMKSDTIIAVLVAIVCMLIYIRIRFSDIRFGISSVLALVHDVLVVIGFYAIARVSVGNTFVACILTIVGYSINATIVIFDRIREGIATMKAKDDLKDVVNASIVQTMTRSIYTSITTLIMVVCLYVFGVTSIREFALPLMVGILCGGFSSVCLAGPAWFMLTKKFPPRPKEEE
ncbi:MAG: protein translocase subunit SecD [Lachnospiraceae bacterium]|nr:protein translocase subunit SecD [Lachnospiraceae bacterium]